MHKQGTIVRWDASRGFGFLRSPGMAADVFFHVRDFRGAPEPAERMEVEYEEIHVGGKGPRAMAVRPRIGVRHAPVNAPQSRPAAPPARSVPARPGPVAGQRQGKTHRPGAPAPARGTAVVRLLMLGWLGLVGWGLWSARLPLWCAGAWLALQPITAWMYAADKNAARSGTWRTSENHLHLLSLLGGWPAAWLAQQQMRHKTSKAPFRRMYWLTTVVHCSALALWLWQGPAALSF